MIYFTQDDGGSPVQNYVVEKKDKGGHWSPVSKFVRDTKCEIPNLIEGEPYEFRVSAVNEHGQGEPLDTDKPVVAKHMFGKFYFKIIYRNFML